MPKAKEKGLLQTPQPLDYKGKPPKPRKGIRRPDLVAGTRFTPAIPGLRPKGPCFASSVLLSMQNSEPVTFVHGPLKAGDVKGISFFFHRLLLYRLKKFSLKAGGPF
jgi:hypothetical protein